MGGSRASYGVPFVTRPFGTMFGSTGGLFGPAGFADVRASLLLRFSTCASPESESRGVLVEELIEDFEVNPQRASNHCEHNSEQSDAMEALTHGATYQMQHQSLCQPVTDGNSFCNVTDSGEQNGSFDKLRSYHVGLDNLQCSRSAARGAYEVNGRLRKRDANCMECTYPRGQLETSRKQTKVASYLSNGKVLWMKAIDVHFHFT